MGIGPALPCYAARFLLGERLSSTKVAEVFSATDIHTGCRVVIKRAGELGRESILSEYRMLSRLSARIGSVVPEIVGDGVLEPDPWFAMAFVPGGNLREFQYKLWGERATPPAARALPADHLETVLTLALELATALASIHGLGVVHGDLSPENVLVAADQRLLLIDFEVAVQVFQAAASAERRATPGYAAPETLRGEPIDSRADMYAWACIVRELLVGEPLFFGATPSALARLHLDAKPLPAGRVVGGVPEWLDALLLESLAKDPRQRRTPACSVVQQIVAHLGRHRRAVDGAARPPLNHPGLVGRNAELRELDARLESAAAGAGGSVTLLGAQGLGKTSLLGELARRGQARRFRVLHGAGSRVAEPPSDVHGRVPLLLGLALQPGLEGGAIVSSNAAEDLERMILQSVVRDGGRSEQEASPLAGLPPESARRRVFRALTHVLSEIGAQRPLLVLLDDVHEADEFTTAFLAGREAKALCNASVLIVAAAAAGSTVRSTQAPAPDVLELGGLDRASTLQLVSELLGVDDGHVGCAGFLHEHCEGNPQLVTRTLQHAIDQCLLRFDAARGWCFPEPAALDASSRAAQKSAISERLVSIAPVALRVAAVAAAIGQSFELGELVEFVEFVEFVEAEVDLQVVLRELIQHGILVPQGRRYAFLHDHLRDACEQQLAESERCILHARLAERLASRDPDDPTLSGKIGMHWLLARRLDLAIPLLTRAAEQLEQALEPFAAIRTLRKAFDALRASLAPDAGWPPALLQVAQRLILLFTRTAQHGPLRALAKEIDEKAGDTDWRVRYRALVELARSLRVTGDYSAAGQQLDRAERLLRRARRSDRWDDLWLDLQEQRIWLLYMKNDAQAIGPVLQRMAPVVRRRGSAKQLAAYYMWSANDLVLRNRYQFSPTAVAEERKGVRLLERANALPELAMAEFDLAFMLILGDLGHCQEALQHLGEARSLAERLCDPVLAARTCTYLAIAERRCGRISACHDWACLALEEARLSGIRGYVGAAQACLGWVAWRREDVRVALEHFAQAQKAWWHRRPQLGQRSHDEFPFQWLAQLPLVAIYASRDEFEAARAAADELLAESQQRLSSPVHELLTRLLRGWSGLAIRDLDALFSDLVRRASELGYV
jgi:hypothetical protein